MSSNYYKLVTVFFIIFLYAGCATENSGIERSSKDDINIMMAIDSEQTGDSKSSVKYYKKLYDSTSKEIYLRKAIVFSFKSKQFKQMIELTNLGLKNYKNKERYYIQQKIIALLQLKKIDEALKYGNMLLAKYKDGVVYEILANIYYAKGDYKKSSQFYQSAYSLNKNENTLVKLATVMYVYLEKKKEALAYLETYLQSKGCNKLVCDRLMLIYQEQGNIDGMISILNRMYERYKKHPELKQTTFMIQNLILSLYEKKDIKEAIKYLEKHKFNQSKLINLYYRNHQLKKALNLTRKMYKKTKNPTLLGKIAMYEFELAKDKKKVLKHVIANFELALSSGINNDSYQNYYGYLLIDYDIDIKKGIKLVKKALKTSPKNISYLDSLAWGYYKIGRCKKAKKLIDSVISVTGLSDPDINKHYKKIQKCNRGKK